MLRVIADGVQGTETVEGANEILRLVTKSNNNPNITFISPKVRRKNRNAKMPRTEKGAKTF